MRQGKGSLSSQLPPRRAEINATGELWSPVEDLSVCTFTPIGHRLRALGGVGPASVVVWGKGFTHGWRTLRQRDAGAG